MAAEDERDKAFLSTWLLTRFSLIQDWNGEMWVNTVGKFDIASKIQGELFEFLTQFLGDEILEFLSQVLKGCVWLKISFLEC